MPYATQLTSEPIYKQWIIPLLNVQQMIEILDRNNFKWLKGEDGIGDYLEVKKPEINYHKVYRVCDNLCDVLFSAILDIPTDI